MFCDEPIIRVYLGEDEYDMHNGADAFLDFFHQLAFHVTEGYRIVLETENWAITLDVNGVTKEPKRSFGARPGEWLCDGIEILDQHPEVPPFVHFESMLFVGERLLDVTNEKTHFRCRFDHFTFMIIPYELGMMHQYLCRKDHRSYNHVLGCDRHLSGNCECGGDGEILLDFVSDFVVRCRKCKKATRAYMDIKSAIDDWNDGSLPCVVDNITIE